MKYFFLIFTLFSVVLSGCEKDQNRKMLNGFFKYSVDGTETVINDEVGFNDNTFNCSIKGDTSLIINVSNLYEGAGFVIDGPIKDSTYTLDSTNKAYYTNPKDLKRYYTTNQYTGTLTIKKSTFEAKTLLYTLQGSFSFHAVDTLSGKNFNITNGSFLMEQK